jgi:hypothetical protein
MAAGEGFIVAADLRTLLGKQLFNELYAEDPGEDVPDNHPAVVQVLRRSRIVIKSYLGPIFTAAEAEFPAGEPSEFLASAQLDLAHAMSYERRPEVAKEYGRTKALDLRKQATVTMDNLRADVQRIPAGDNPPDATTPRTSGGIITFSGSRILIDSPDGTSNGGDF